MRLTHLRQHLASGLRASFRQLQAASGCRKNEMHRSASAELGFNPDSATMAFNDFLADGQAYAGARIFFAAMEALENNKNSLEILGGDPDAVIGDGNFPFIAVENCAEMDLRRVLAAELNRITQE